VDKQTKKERPRERKQTDEQEKKERSKERRK
jgi:hypothetical protein